MPQKSQISIIDATQNAYECIKGFEVTKKTLQQYWYCGVIPIRRYFRSHNREFYTPELIKDCVCFLRTQYEQGFTYPAKFRCVRKISAIMETIRNGNTVIWNHLTPWRTINLPPPFNNYLEQYCEAKREQGYKETTLRGLKPVLKHFLLYASSLGYKNLLTFTESDAENYIPVLAESYQRVGDCLSLLRDFGAFLLDRGLVIIQLKKLFQLKVPTRKKCYTGFTNEEAIRIISSIDRSTSCGKRDYAILMLAMNTGLRGIDIQQLTFSNIDWKDYEIHFVQSKTNNQLILPVSISVLNAIADYILNARPKSDEKSIVFLRTRKPHVALKSWSAYSIVKRNAGHAGIKWPSSERKGFHSFRRSIASWMLDAEVPLDTIKEVLGHTSVDSSKPYISVHQSGLAACALDINVIPLRREELR